MLKLEDAQMDAIDSHILTGTQKMLNNCLLYNGIDANFVGERCGLDNF